MRAWDPLTHNSACGPTLLTALDAAAHHFAPRLPAFPVQLEKDLRLVGLQPPLVANPAHVVLTVKSESLYSIVVPEEQRRIERKRGVSCVRCEVRA